MITQSRFASVVFDGVSLPIKKRTDEKHRIVRESARKKTEKLVHEGHGDTTAAKNAETSAFKATHVIIHNLVILIRTTGYDVIVSPHEG